MKAKLVLTQGEPYPLMAKVVLGHLQYDIEDESLKRFLKDYHYDKTMWENVDQARRNSWLEQANKNMRDNIERISKSENPRQELLDYLTYLNTPIAVA